MKIVAGSYERFLWGWQVKQNAGKLQPLFSYPAHLGAIKCIAATSGGVLVSGSSDDAIKVFDLHAHRDMGTLSMHNGAVTCLKFHAPESAIEYSSYLFSGSEDATICIWETDSWIHLKTLKCKAAINDLAIHPSGRLGLSVERDGHFRMWNLNKGRCSFTKKLSHEGTTIDFCPNPGDTFAIARGQVTETYNAQDGSLLHSFMHQKRVLCMTTDKDKILFTGGEDGIIRGWDLVSGKQAFEIPNAHSNRIKGLTFLGRATSSNDEEYALASGSSDGFVRVWDIRTLHGMDSQTKRIPLMEEETKARLTCLISIGSLKLRRKLEGVNIPQESTQEEQIQNAKAELLERKMDTNLYELGVRKRKADLESGLDLGKSESMEASAINASIKTLKGKRKNPVLQMSHTKRKTKKKNDKHNISP